MSFIPGLGFNDAEFSVAVFQDVVTFEFLCSSPKPFEAAHRDFVLTSDATSFHESPASGSKRGVDVIGTGFGFYYGCPRSLSCSLSSS